jgi:hypothetical protein
MNKMVALQWQWPVLQARVASTVARFSLLRDMKTIFFTQKGIA